MKTARNGPCPCGSGKKYKRCHGLEDGSLGTPRDTAREYCRAFLTDPERKPGCYNDPEFLELEKADPQILEEYARFAVTRARSASETARIRSEVGTIAEGVVANLSEAEATRRCADVSSAIIAILEAQGIWCFGVRGSVRFSFARELGLTDRYFWIRDTPDFPGAFLGHAWIVVPPIAILDCTARFQDWRRGESTYIPNPICSDNPAAVEPDRRLFASSPLPIPMPWSPSLLDIWAWCPPRKIREGKVTVWYQPDGIALPEATLSKIDNITIGGRRPSAFYAETLRPILC
jgi:SEC-C motif.